MSNESPWSTSAADIVADIRRASRELALVAATPPFDTIVLTDNAGYAINSRVLAGFMRPVRLLDSPADTFAGKAGPFGPPGRTFWIATRRDRTRVIVDFEPHVDDWRLYVRAELPGRLWSLKDVSA